MPVFECLDNRRLGEEILAARRRVVLCIPGFADEVASALISVWRRLGSSDVSIIVDGGDTAARLGYGHFDAVKMLTDAGVPVRLEPGLRLGVAVVDDHGWCFAAPPLLVDATMEGASAPNALRLSGDQIRAFLRAASPWLEDPDEEKTTEPEIGRIPATAETIERVHQSLSANPPQAFDLARRVHVFNAFVEFLEIELLGTQIGRQRVALPSQLVLSVSDAETRKRLNTSFEVLGENSAIRHSADALREAAEAIRRDFTRVLPGFGRIALRTDRAKLLKAVEELKVSVAEFRIESKRALQGELEASRLQLTESILPGIRTAPPRAATVGIAGSPTDEHLRKWIDLELEKVFPTADRILGSMEVRFSPKGVLHETLQNPNFHKAVRKAYPQVDFDEPFEAFSAVIGDRQAF